MKKIRQRKNESLGDYSARFLAMLCNKDGSTMGSSCTFWNYSNIESFCGKDFANHLRQK